MKVIYTVDLDPGDSPEVRGRLRIQKNRVGYGVVEAIRKAMEEALWVWSVEDRYKGFTDTTYRQPHVGQITMRIEGPRDTYKGS